MSRTSSVSATSRTSTVSATSHTSNVSAMDVGCKTLIAIDDSPAAEQAFQFYATNLRQPNGSVLLLHVVEPRTINSNRTVLRLFEFREKAATEEKKRVRELQERYEERMRSFGIKGRIVITYYSRYPGKVICQTATSEGCSMIMIGYSSKTLRSHVGSVCKYVFHNAPCPVAVVPSSGPADDFLASSSSPPRRSFDLPPDYDSARRFSLAVPMLRPTFEIVKATLGSSCPDISELGDEYGSTAKQRSTRKAIIDAPADGLRMITAQVHETKL